MDKIKQFEPFFGEWYAESFIGAGSYGRVYKIYREEFGERFYSALKYISIPADESETAQLRIDGMDEKSISEYYTEITKDISTETRLMNKLRGNTNVVGFEDSKIQPKEGGMGYDVFIRMELLTPLTARIISKPLTPADTVKLGRDVCTALELCQKQGIIHRDIKPDNIFVNENGDYKLGDFGIARRLEKTSTFMSKKGTYNYMAPEVYKGEKYGASCDIYSLGIVMYRLLNNGRLPFLPAAPNPISPEDRENAIVRRMSGERLPAPCNADPGLAAIVLKACAYDPKERFASAAQMRDALSKLSTASRKPSAAGAAVPGIADDADKTQRVRKTPVNDRHAKPAAIKEKPEKKRNKTGLFIGVAAALALAFGLMAVLGVFGKKQPEPVIDANADTPTPDPVVTFSDSTFDSAFRNKYGYVGKTIHESDLLKFTELELKNCGLKNISDVAKFKNLTELRLHFNSISNISPLAGLTNLTSLDLGNNSISNISPLAGLTKLTDLILGYNSISNISSLAGLTNLTWLDLGYNSISNITPLAGLTKLTTLYLYDNSISNISPLTGLTKLTNLSLHRNSISDISPLAGLTNLTSLGLSNNNISNISPLAGMTNLTWLDLGYNSISNISSLAGLTNLTTLYLNDNSISDITPLAGLTNLTSLYLYRNSISNITPLDGLTNLTDLYLDYNPLTQSQIDWLQGKLPNCSIMF